MSTPNRANFAVAGLDDIGGSVTNMRTATASVMGINGSWFLAGSLDIDHEPLQRSRRGKNAYVFVN